MVEEQYLQGGNLFSLVDRIGRRYTDTFLKEKGVGRGQVPYLMELYHHDGVNQDYLAQQVAMDKSTAARAIQKLEAGGLVVRVQNPQDKRENLVYLTDAGREIHPYVKGLQGQWFQLVTEAFSAEERSALIAMLEKMRDKAIAYRNHPDQHQL